eukprot:9154952-Pyramimonas_sp.AAC.1
MKAWIVRSLRSSSAAHLFHVRFALVDMLRFCQTRCTLLRVLSVSAFDRGAAAQLVHPFGGQ